MDDGGPIERRTGWDRRGSGERRRTPDRRCEPDRRGKPSAKTEASDEPRSYGFRSFADRRGRAERRRDADGGGDRRKRIEDRRAGIVRQDDTDVELTPEEVLALLHYPTKEDD